MIKRNLGLFLLEENVRNVEVLPKEAAHLVLEFVAYVSKFICISFYLLFFGTPFKKRLA